MKNHSYSFVSLLLLSLQLISCGGHEQQISEERKQREENEREYEEGFTVFTSEQFETLNMKVGPLAKRSVATPIYVNGILEVPPQHEAVVTTVIGANITSIQVIEGDPVKKGQVLAYLMHPDLIRLQSDYLEAFNRHELVEQEFNRQKKLYEENVGAGKTFQQSQTEYRTLLGLLKSHESQLRLLGIDPGRVKEGKFTEKVAIVSPLEGSVVNVSVKLGQYVQPQTPLFELINTDDIHIKLMIYERDIPHVKIGQTLQFWLNTDTEAEMTARIFSINQKFEQHTKAVQVHAEIENETTSLVPGMYIKARIFPDSQESYVLPESAVFNDASTQYVFELTSSGGETGKWIFFQREVRITGRQDGWVAVDFIEKIPEDAFFALNNAYYIMAEMKKGEVTHD